MVEEHEAAIRERPGIAGTLRETFKFKKSVYGHSTVKKTLMEDQLQKCCYCEGYFAGHASGDVEHYRPKAFSQQTEGGERIYPGYYWLAYSWGNLYYSCEICNRVRKRNLFPLRDPSRRARSSTDDVAEEDPMLLDPGGAEDPREHIRFIDNVPFGVTDIGKRTVEVLGLDRPALNRARLPFLKILDSLKRIAQLPDAAVTNEELSELRTHARTELNELTKPNSQYSAMAQDYLAA